MVTAPAPQGTFHALCLVSRTLDTDHDTSYPVLLNGSSLDDCGRLDDCLDKTSRILVFFLLKSRISHTTIIAFRLYSL
jgi:hypothetical protein